MLLIVLGAAVAGAAAQRITGLGSALVSAPFFVLAVGPFDGILLANLMSLLNSAVIFSLTRRDAEIGKAISLAVPAVVVGIPAGLFIINRVPERTLTIGVSGLIIVALSVVVSSPRTRVFRGRVGAVFAGSLSGLMNVTAGVGGPAIILYAVSTSWPHRNFVASVQLFAVVLNLFSIAAKGFPQASCFTFAAVLVGMGIGTTLGHRVSGIVSDRTARQSFISIAFIGASASLVKAMIIP